MYETVIVHRDWTEMDGDGTRILKGVYGECACIEISRDDLFSSTHVGIGRSVAPCGLVGDINRIRGIWYPGVGDRYIKTGT